MVTMYTAQEVAKMLRIGYKTLMNLIAAGEIKAVKVGSRWRIEETEYQRYMDAIRSRN